jgi:3'-phosphoadenosine 5'-phosphosulfate sulfotransferase (PAPS reductase)/FAD synthetase
MITKGRRAILQFSGGKDSTALLYYMRPHLKDLTVVHVNTGAILPEVEGFIGKTCLALGARLDVVRPPVDVFQYTDYAGYPSDIVPFESTHFFRYGLHGPHNGQLLQSYGDCCAAMMWMPLKQYIKENKIDLVFRGSKRIDTRVGVPDGHIEDGVEYRSPLWNWSHEAVFHYLDLMSVTLPPHYQLFADSLDCWICTGHLKHCGKERIQYIKEKHPEKWPILQKRLEKVERAIVDEMVAVSSAFEESQDG